MARYIVSTRATSHVKHDSSAAIRRTLADPELFWRGRISVSWAKPPTESGIDSLNGVRGEVLGKGIWGHDPQKLEFCLSDS